ncbi:hypothetical protein [Streptomyces angustmyceticus]|uniref:hypothetical protein n=1 Tax=Streptomyces angustmyceticus TaxID=285578 RepID=UPI003D8B51B3
MSKPGRHEGGGAIWPEEAIELSDIQSNVYLGMFRCTARESVRRRIADSGYVVRDGEVEEMLRYFVDRDLAFEETVSHRAGECQ